MSITNEEFIVILEKRVEKIHSILKAKSTEYGMNNNRFHNFEVAARCGPMEQSREQALEGMMRKHLVSVYDLITMPETRTLERIDEKIGDLINYLILLEAMLKEGL